MLILFTIPHGMKDIDYIIKHLETSLELEETARLVRENKKNIYWSHLHGSAPALYLSMLQKRIGKPLLCILPDKDQAGYFFNDISVTYQGKEQSVFFFPSSYRKGIRYGAEDSANEILRNQLLQRLRGKEDPPAVVVTYPEALIEGVVDEKLFAKGLIELSIGDEIDRQKLRTSLWDMGFEETDYVYEPGHFAVRGNIIDIFSFANDFPARLDFFGDEIESIRFFDPETQLSRDNVERLCILSSFQGKGEKRESLLNLIDQDSPIYIETLEDLSTTLDDVWNTTPANPQENVFRTLDALREVLISPSVLVAELRSHLLISRDIVSEERQKWIEINWRQRPEPLFHKNFRLLSENLTKLQEEGYETLIMSNQDTQIQRLESILRDLEVDVSFTPIIPTLHAGFIDTSTHLACYTDHTIFERFHKYHLKSDNIRNNSAVLTLKEINKFEYGDYIVHMSHGIGTFAGLFTIEQNGKKQECIRINYRGGDSIYVSIHALHHISKYKSKDSEEPPQLAKLGSGAWERLKDRTKKKVKDIARDLIKLYAQRLEEKGFAFSPDTYLQKELEASFKYEDTPDQLEATLRVKEDMEKPIPMDRLICGDVGFGKTEIAVRAAFKAVADSKQVAVLVPTTVLAYQHFMTFRRRLQDFPCRIEYLSRAKNTSERSAILNDLKEGRIDIIVGTHALTAKNVKFKDLGLIIIDEEQKFGVAVKEKLRQYRTHVDTLTLTATPIPRTLQFSLMGARDLSNILTPPPNRKPIRTEIALLTEELVRDAVTFELDRGGQVYFIHNRIHNLNDIKNFLHKAVPKARVAIAHGQLEPKELEKVLLAFAEQEYDILLSTSIVENGIDISNANTIFINDAHRFGLSDLHQLRGRVGRGNERAFCYLLSPPKDLLTPEAKRRLKAIFTFSDLGSGIHIAMQDLDIRGAGNLLGAEQSGFIADLGYEAYRRILEESVLELKDEEFSDIFSQQSDPGVSSGSQQKNPPGRVYVYDTYIETDTEAFFPPDYVPGDDERITLYRELEKIDSTGELHTYKKQLLDRFGAIPSEAEELFHVMLLRMLGKRCGIEKIILKQGQLKLQLVSDLESSYYQTSTFSNILHNSAKYPQVISFSEKNGLRAILIKGIKDASSAYRMITELTELTL